VRGQRAAGSKPDPQNEQWECGPTGSVLTTNPP
jgi:hypothetical protein